MAGVARGAIRDLVWQAALGADLWRSKVFVGVHPGGRFCGSAATGADGALEGESEVKYADLPKIKAMDKIIVAFAGPLFSFGLAILIACIVWGIGRPVSQTETTTVVGYVFPESRPSKRAFFPVTRFWKSTGGQWSDGQVSVMRSLGES